MTPVVRGVVTAVLAELKQRARDLGDAHARDVSTLAVRLRVRLGELVAERMAGKLDDEQFRFGVRQLSTAAEIARLRLVGKTAATARAARAAALEHVAGVALRVTLAAL